MILSRFPIERHETLSFKNQFKAEQFGVNRGALYARITLPDTTNTKGRSKGRSGGRGRALPGGLDLVTCHTTASMAEALLKVKKTEEEGDDTLPDIILHIDGGRRRHFSY